MNAENTQATFKFACPHCGQHLEAEPDWAGMEVECPTCGKAITVPDPQQSTHLPDVPPSTDAKATSDLVSDALSATDSSAIPEPDFRCAASCGEDQEAEVPEIDIAEHETEDPRSSAGRVFRAKSFLVRHRDMFATIAGVVIAPIFVRVAFLKPVYHYSYKSPSYEPKPVQSGQSGYVSGNSGYRNAWSMLTREQQLAIGKVMYMCARFYGIQQQMTTVDRDKAAGMTLVFGMAAAQFLPRVNDDETPEDFKQAWRKFVGYLAAANIGNAMAAGNAQYGGGLSAQDLETFRTANEEFYRAREAFWRVVAKYGGDNMEPVIREVQSKIDSGIWTVDDLLRKKSQEPKPETGGPLSI